MDPLEKRKKARAAAKAARNKDLDSTTDKILEYGKRIENTEEGSSEEKALTKKRNLYIKYFNRRKQQ